MTNLTSFGYLWVLLQEPTNFKVCNKEQTHVLLCGFCT